MPQTQCPRASVATRSVVARVAALRFRVASATAIAWPLSPIPRPWRGDSDLLQLRQPRGDDRGPTHRETYRTSPLLSWSVVKSTGGAARNTRQLWPQASGRARQGSEIDRGPPVWTTSTSLSPEMPGTQVELQLEEHLDFYVFFTEST